MGGPQCQIERLEINSKLIEQHQFRVHLEIPAKEEGRMAGWCGGRKVTRRIQVD